MRAKRARNCSRVMRPAARGESVRRNSRRPGLARPKRWTSRTMRVGGLFFYAQDAAGEVALVGPEMHQWTFAFDAEFELQGGEFGEPFAVFADFHAAGRRQVARARDPKRPNRSQTNSTAHRHGITLPPREACGSGYCKYQASNTYGRILLIPLRGNMFESDLEFAAQAGVERRVAIGRDARIGNRAG